MALLILSFVAGVLTVAAPCILPLLPVIVGGTIARDKKAVWYRPLVITASLAGSIVIFTLLLKASTQFLGVPDIVWRVFSASIVLLFGLNLLFPTIWDRVAAKLYIGSNKFLGKSSRQKGLAGDALMGFALGPVFNSCSPTYALLVATVLPASFARGTVYLIAYALGLALMLLVVAYAGQTLIKKLGWLANPFGWFRKVIGILFIVVGLSVLFGWDRKLQAFVIEKGWYAPISNLEQSLDR